MKRDIGPRTKRFVRDLKKFCQAEQGRGFALAAYLGIPSNKVYSWWSGERFPTTEQLLGAQEWLETERKEK
jgi:hypothetical protein